ncbi:hypothetical protein [Streptomyces sp. NPDC058092]|uniref:hypothetical protein n=1 Tax=Streptomyces sp. NPDC058092 TaxID=3346336 RepID=UPI0036F10385
MARTAARKRVRNLAAPLPSAAPPPRYAQVGPSRLRSPAEGPLSAEDLAVPDTVIGGDGPLSVLRRQGLTVRAAHTTWVARRP